MEEYIDGPEFTVDGIVMNNRHSSLAVAEKKHLPKNLPCKTANF